MAAAPTSYKGRSDESATRVALISLLPSTTPSSSVATTRDLVSSFAWKVTSEAGAPLSVAPVSSTLTLTVRVELPWSRVTVKVTAPPSVTSVRMYCRS